LCAAARAGLELAWKAAGAGTPGESEAAQFLDETSA